jgi:nitroreductase
MNASNAFRSHLMQQFASAARMQSRPPLALIGWNAEDEKPLSTSQTLSLSHQSTPSRPISSIHTSLCSRTSPLFPPRDHERVGSTNQSEVPHRFSSSYVISEEAQIAKHDEESSGEDLVEISVLFQNMLKTRRSNSSFLLAPPEDLTYWRDALGRAASCGYNAPNHKRTEPFTFKRMISPSASTDRLADIAYNVSIRDQKAKKPEARPSAEAIREKAEKKRNKWRHIPAYLVALVTSRDAVLDSGDNHSVSEYEDLPYVPLANELEMENYAAACAAVQNVLLSLHSEQIASKWVTGPVIRTRAFRELVGAEPTDRVVGLIMVGQPVDSKRVRGFRRRRSLDGDVLIDI